MLGDERHRKPCQILPVPPQLLHQDGDKGSSHETWFLLVELLLLILTGHRASLLRGPNHCDFRDLPYQEKQVTTQGFDYLDPQGQNLGAVNFSQAGSACIKLY